MTANTPSRTLRHEPCFYPLNGPVEEPFDCGTPEQNDFLLKHAWEYQEEGYATTHLMYCGDDLVGYVALAAGELQLNKTERPSTAPFSRLPALKIGQMGVVTKYQGLGLGRDLVDYAITLALHESKSASYRYVILDARPEKVGFYAKLGFVSNEEVNKVRQTEAQKSRKRKGQPLPISMRFDLRAPGTTDIPRVRIKRRSVRIYGMWGAIGALFEMMKPRSKRSKLS